MKSRHLFALPALVFLTFLLSCSRELKLDLSAKTKELGVTAEITSRAWRKSVLFRQRFNVSADEGDYPLQSGKQWLLIRVKVSTPRAVWFKYDCRLPDSSIRIVEKEKSYPACAVQYLAGGAPASDDEIVFDRTDTNYFDLSGKRLATYNNLGEEKLSMIEEGAHTLAVLFYVPTNLGQARLQLDATEYKKP